ncbi:hypothetical protein EDB92DRAFT_1817196 [Lactarius akahatsu]|uniref:Uncharacterized protein n=1 Tax=Lactarius akahatsu TaxID=416441 RepID=A0AAD4Q9S5_9AGAM|nr:hypothetical protein EDB92DRAFT_1817196 [Lactarius akahatsu]
MLPQSILQTLTGPIPAPFTGDPVQAPIFIGELDKFMWKNHSLISTPLTCIATALTFVSRPMTLIWRHRVWHDRADHVSVDEAWDDFVDSFCETWVHSPELTSPDAPAAPTLACAKDATLEKTAEEFPQQHASVTTDQTTDPATGDRSLLISRTSVSPPSLAAPPAQITPVNESPQQSLVATNVGEILLTESRMCTTIEDSSDTIPTSPPRLCALVECIDDEILHRTSVVPQHRPLPPQHHPAHCPVVVPLPEDDPDHLVVTCDPALRTGLSPTPGPTVETLMTSPGIICSPAIANLVACDDSIRIKDPSSQSLSTTLILACLVTHAPPSFPRALTLSQELVSTINAVDPLRSVMPSHRIPRSSASPSRGVASLGTTLSSSPSISQLDLDPCLPATSPLSPQFSLPLHPVLSPFVTASYPTPLFDPTSRSPLVVVGDNLSRRGVKTSQHSVSTSSTIDTTQSS